MDAASDAVLADFAGAIYGTAVTFVITHRPEFYGALQRRPNITVGLQPLEDAVTVELTGYLLGGDRSLGGLAHRIARVAAGNPYFVEEVVRDLAGRGVLAGSRGGYRLLGDADDIGVPVTVQAVLAARIDRLSAAAKSVLNAAAVVGSRFDEETLGVLVPGELSSELAELVATELVDQTEFTPRQRYCFRHPLVRTVAYDSQLSVTRNQAHRQVAVAIEARDPGAQDKNAALIASHLEAAGDLEQACEWHLRSAEWLRPRDLLAARAQWESAMHVADRLPDDADNIVALRIAPRTMLISTELFIGTDPENDQRFLELRDLTARSHDMRSLAIAIAGRIMAFTINGIRVPEGTVLAVELEKIVDTLDGVPVAELEILLTAMASTKMMNCEFDAALRVINRSIALLQEQPSLDRAVAFALRGLAEVCLGRHAQGIEDLETATALARLMPPVSFSSILIYWGMLAGMGLYLPYDLVGEMRDALRRAESFGDRFGIIGAQWAYGSVLLRADPASHDEAVGVLEDVSQRIKTHGLLLFALASIESDLATAAASRGHRDEAIDQLRDLVPLHMRDGSLILIGCSAEALVALLSERGSPADLEEAARLIEHWRVRRPGGPAIDLWWQKSRAVLAAARGDVQRSAGFAQEYLVACEELDARGRIAEARHMVAASACADGA